jgi:hypothetical protein
MNKLAILPLLAILFTVGLVNSAYAQFGDHDISEDTNVSENPADADRKVVPPKSYGSKNNDKVCGDHLCAPGETPPYR